MRSSPTFDQAASGRASSNESRRRVTVVRTAALSRHKAPDFVLQFGLELIQLRRLDDFAFRVFIELLAMADFITGQINTSHAVLIGLLDYDRTPRAHEGARASKKRLQRVFAELVALNLIFDFDTDFNERRRGLFFRVAGRRQISAPASMSVPMSVPSKKRAKPALAPATAVQGRDEGTDERTGVQETRNSISPTPPLSTGTDHSRWVLDARAKIKSTRKSPA